MKRIKYIGPLPAVVYKGLVFERDKPVEVEDDELAESMKKKPYFSGVRGKTRGNDDS